MKNPRLIWIILVIIECGFLFAQAPVTIISYNVENLFDNQHDSLKNDSSFLPEGDHHWTFHKYQTKLDQIAQVIVNIAGWDSAPLVGLCEVENARCLRDLCYRLRRFHYRYVHYESADERGIDVALLYDSTKIQVLSSQPIVVDLNGDVTRDVLYVSALINKSDTLHTFMCHLPSQLGGAEASADKRFAAKRLIQHKVDSILSIHPHAYVVVMGDMNSNPQDDIRGMINMMMNWDGVGYGTQKHQGTWSFLDQFYVSSALRSQASAHIFSPEWLLEEDEKYLGYRPKRTFIGFRYHAGYSDHLPIVLRLDMQ